MRVRSFDSVVRTFRDGLQRFQVVGDPSLTAAGPSWTGVLRSREREAHGRRVLDRHAHRVAAERPLQRAVRRQAVGRDGPLDELRRRDALPRGRRLERGVDLLAQRPVLDLRPQPPQRLQRPGVLDRGQRVDRRARERGPPAACCRTSPGAARASRGALRPPGRRSGSPPRRRRARGPRGSGARARNGPAVRPLRARGGIRPALHGLRRRRPGRYRCGATSGTGAGPSGSPDAGRTAPPPPSVRDRGAAQLRVVQGSRPSGTWVSSSVSSSAHSRFASEGRYPIGTSRRAKWAEACRSQGSTSRRSPGSSPRRRAGPH